MCFAKSCAWDLGNKSFKEMAVDIKRPILQNVVDLGTNSGSSIEIGEMSDGVLLCSLQF